MPNKMLIDSNTSLLDLYSQIRSEESGLAKRIRSLRSVIYWVNPRLEGIESIS